MEDLPEERGGCAAAGSDIEKPGRVPRATGTRRRAWQPWYLPRYIAPWTASRQGRLKGEVVSCKASDVVFSFAEL